MITEKIMSISPLTPMQQAFLFHKLAGGVDEGFLQVQYVIKGELNLPL